MSGGRSVHVEGCFNVRDAGGWATSVDDRGDRGDRGARVMRTGVLYRADDAIRITRAGRKVIDALGFRAVFDLRQPAQVARRPGFADPAITYHLPLVDRVIDTSDPPPLAAPADIADLYDDMVTRAGGRLVEVVDAVAAHVGEGPVLVHCAAGKDRTGIVVALIQAAIGMPLDAIVREYALSDIPTRQRRQAMIAEPLHDDPPIALSPEYLWTAPAEAMALFAGRSVERHGSLEGWSAAVGIVAETRVRLRAALLS